MDLILATSDGREERFVTEDFDFEIGGDNTFEVSLPFARWTGDLQYGKLIYEVGTECGGIIKAVKSDTGQKKIFIDGYTWRGYLAHRVIEPPAGSSHKVVSGDLNTVIADVIGDSLGPLFRVSAELTGVTVSNYQFDRYVTVDAGLNKMLRSVGYRLAISYIQSGSGGYVLLEAVPALNYSDDVQLSQDSRLNFISEDNRMGVNHLICLGTGEQEQRTVLHLYADQNGSISQTKTISGIDEIVSVYEYTSADTDQLLENGEKQFANMLNYQSFTATINSVEDDLQIGDTITGRDFVTGNSVTKPVIRKIIKRVGGVVTIDYKIEGES